MVGIRLNRCAAAPAQVGTLAPFIDFRGKAFHIAAHLQGTGYHVGFQHSTLAVRPAPPGVRTTLPGCGVMEFKYS